MDDDSEVSVSFVPSNFVKINGGDTNESAVDISLLPACNVVENPLRLTCIEEREVEKPGRYVIAEMMSPKLMKAKKITLQGAPNHGRFLTFVLRDFTQRRLAQQRIQPQQ
jgi:hypothetical protein